MGTNWSRVDRFACYVIFHACVSTDFFFKISLKIISGAHSSNPKDVLK